MTDLIAEFDTGRAAQLEGGECPFYATSSSAEAWHAGKAYEARRPSVYGPGKVWAGRGGRVNVRDDIGHPSKTKAPVFVYRVTWSRAGVHVAREK